ncbi:MAG: hypothetical protein IIB83_05025 [Bacteroidetes bacterium]|nr:hypothetical protein [Bacteroidota bacterium]
MKKLNFIFFFLYLAVVAPNYYTQSTNPQIKLLVGKWKSIRNTDKGIEINIKFSKDGSVKYDVGVNLKGTYILKGNRLISYFKDLKTNKIEVDTSIIEINGNILIQRSIVSGKKIKMTRLNKTKTNSKQIIGKWESYNYNSYHAITEFNAFYGINVLLSVKSIEGSFVVEKNMITIFSPTTYRMRLNYKITKNIMTLHNLENGKDLTMVKLND